MSLDTYFTGDTSILASRHTTLKTLAKEQHRQRLELALDNLSNAKPPLLFARRWQLLQARAYGGQAVVQVRSPILGHNGPATMFHVQPCISRQNVANISRT